MRFLFVLSILLWNIACTPSVDLADQAADSEHPWRQPGDVIDSILPMEEYLARFRVGTREVGSLAGGAATVEELAVAFLSHLEAGDTASLRALKLTKGEFAWLVFPNHLYREPPYELDPAILWGQMAGESNKGLGRLMREFAKHDLTFRSVACSPDTLTLRSGVGTMASNCVMEYEIDGTHESRRLFGSIYQRDGRQKLVGFSNEF